MLCSKLEQVGRIKSFPGKSFAPFFSGWSFGIFLRAGPRFGSVPEPKPGMKYRWMCKSLTFAMWESAVNLAARYRVDTAIAAEALTAATYATTDRLAGSGRETDGKIRDVRNYLFATYMYRIFDIARKQSPSQANYVDMKRWVANSRVSDNWTFLEGLENTIYCREFLDAMPPKAKSVAIARYVLGYSWPETAGALGSTVNAAQKALSVGVRKTIGTCMRELRRARHRKLVDIQIGKKSKKAFS